MLDHFPLPRDHFQRLGDSLAELPQPRATAALAGRGTGHDNALAGQMLRERLTRGTLAGKGINRRRLGCRLLGRKLVLGGGRLQLFEFEVPSGRGGVPCAPSAGRRSGA